MKAKLLQKTIIILTLCAMLSANAISAGSYNGGEGEDSGDTISRAAFTAMVMEAFAGEAPPDANTEPFDDVPLSSPYYALVTNARALGFVSGVGNNMFIPDAALTNQDMFVILYNALGAPDVPPAFQTDQCIEFDDWGDVAQYAREPIQTLAKMDLIQGSALNPKNHATYTGAALGLAVVLAGGYRQNDATAQYLALRNNIDTVFAVYSIVYVESKNYGIDLRGLGGENVTQNSVFVRRNGGISAHIEFSFEDGYANGYTIEHENVYFYYPDGVFGKYAFFGDGYFETFYLPHITEIINYSLTEGELFISDSSENNIRTLISHMDASAIDSNNRYGISSGILETVYEFEAESGFLLRAAFSVKAGGESRLIGETVLTYDQDVSFAEPEYVALCKDMSETRAVSFIMPDGEAINHVLPKNAFLVPLAMADYEFYADPEYTVPFDMWSYDFPDEMAVYVRLLES